jgi:type VI protein secretion system component VasK
MIRRFFSVFASLMGVILFVTLILSACIWAFGPFLAVGGWRPLDGLWERVIAIVVLWLLAILTIVLIRWRRKARDRKISAEIVEAVATSFQSSA